MLRKNKNEIEKVYEKVKVPNTIKEDKKKGQLLDRKAKEFKKQNNVISITEDMF